MPRKQDLWHVESGVLNRNRIIINIEILLKTNKNTNMRPSYNRFFFFFGPFAVKSINTFEIN